MLKLVLILALSGLTFGRYVKSKKSSTAPLPPITTYDQRQTGKYNIHLNIKDVQIISLEGDNFDGGLGDDTIYDYGEYDYDPAHLTIDPIGGLFGSASFTQKPKPSSTTEKANVTQSSVTQAPETPSTTKKPENENPTTKAPELTTKSPTEVQKPVQHDEEPSSTRRPSPIYFLRPTGNSQNPVGIDYEEIPVEVIVEPVLKPKRRASNRPITFRKKKFGQRHSVQIFPDENQEVRTTCRQGEVMDKQGRCRTRRSGIYNLLNMLTILKDKEDRE